jgi:hypothetical protein
VAAQVRGTTSREIVQMCREAGAKRVYMASAAPPVCYPNVYGIDMPTKDELIASDAYPRTGSNPMGPHHYTPRDATLNAYPRTGSTPRRCGFLLLTCSR